MGECQSHYPGWNNNHPLVHQEDGSKWWTAKWMPQAAREGRAAANIIKDKPLHDLYHRNHWHPLHYSCTTLLLGDFMPLLQQQFKHLSLVWWLVTIHLSFDHIPEVFNGVQEIGLIRENDLTPVLYGPILMVFCKPQPGSSLLLIDEGFFLALHYLSPVSRSRYFKPFLLCTSPQLPFVGHLMSSNGCWVTFEWVDSHASQWRVVSALCQAVALWSPMSAAWPFYHIYGLPFYYIYGSFLLEYMLYPQTFIVWVHRLQEASLKAEEINVVKLIWWIELYYPWRSWCIKAVECCFRIVSLLEPLW